MARALNDATSSIGRVGASTVSRWETGHKVVPDAALRAYESVLEVPAGALTSCADVVGRYWSPQLAPPLSSHRWSAQARYGPGRLDALLDAVVGDQSLTGADWDQLTEALARTTELYLRPRDWTDLADRLLRELLIADRGHYLRRREAFQRLLVHPQGQTAAIAAAVSAGDDRTGQAMIEALSALDGSGHPDASRAVVRQLQHPSTPSAQVGALQAAVRKVRFGHFDPRQLATVVEVTESLIRAGRDDEDLVALAGELADHVHGTGKAAKSLATAVAALAERSGPGGSGAARERVVVDRLVLATIAGAGVPESFDDDVLPRLTGELMFSPSADIRLLASSLVAVSPFRAAMAGAVATELTSARVLTDQVEWADKLLDTLRLIGGQDQVQLVQRLATADGLPASVGRAAAVTLGHVGGRIERPFWARAFGKYAVLWRRHHLPAHAHHLGGLVYSAGVLGEIAVLSALHADPTLPASTRTAAAWWLNLPHHVSSGARL